MQVRRWSIAAGLVGLWMTGMVGAAPPASAPVAATAPAPAAAPMALDPTKPGLPQRPAIQATMKAHAAALRTASAASNYPDLQRIKDDIVSVVTPRRGVEIDVTFRYEYAAAASDTLAPMLKDPKAALVVAMALASMDSYAAGAALREALNSSRPDVRYWAAKGLGKPDMMRGLSLYMPDYEKALAALETALAKEPSPLVRDALIRALGASAYDNSHKAAVPVLLKTIEPMVAGLAKNPGSTLAPVLGSMVVLRDLSDSGKLTKPEQALAARLAVSTASFVAQHNLNNPMPEAYETVDAAVRLLNAVLKPGRVDWNAKSTDSPEDLLLAVNAVTGSEGTAGQVQKLVPDMAIPPRIAH